MTDKRVPVRLTSRDFTKIKSDLVEYAKRYYPDTYQDFNEAGFGSLMMDMTAYVGDMLSFYLDYQANESFIDSATEFNNVLRHAKNYGYKYTGAKTSFGECDFYIIVPASSDGSEPDYAYAPKLLKNTKLNSKDGTGFLLNEDLDFASMATQVAVARVDSTTGAPTHYALKNVGEIISGEFLNEFFTIGAFERFKRLELSNADVSEVISVVDTEGNEYFEVDYLSQNVIFKAVVNRKDDKDTVQNILKPVYVPRRFVVEYEKDKTFLVFGHGSDDEITQDSVAEPNDIVLQKYGKDYITDSTIDPSKFISTDKFGVAPSNTTLRVVFRSNTNQNSNAAANSITEVTSPILVFENMNTLQSSKITSVRDGLEVNNAKPIVGDVTLPTTDELKRRAIDSFATQNRAVTKQDYVSMAYAMPNKFGAVKRCSVIRDRNSFKRNLNMYVISENSNGNLIQCSQTLKENLKTWLNRVKMVNDTIDILDAYIVNFAVECKVTGEFGKNKFDVKRQTEEEIRKFFAVKMDIGEPIVLTDIFRRIKDLTSVKDVVDIKIVPKVGGIFSDVNYDFAGNMSCDARLVSVPVDHILEMRYPTESIKVMVVG